MKQVRASQRGAALLTVLLLVAVMATASALALERLTLATRLSGSASAMEQARFALLNAEQLALPRTAALAAGERTTLAGNWHARPFTVMLLQGSATVQLTDGANCFNLNSLVNRQADGMRRARPIAMEQFARLLSLIGVDAATAARIVAGATDRIDSDTLPLAGGDEDGAPGMVMTDPAELTDLPGMTPALYTRIAPWVCALPASDLSPININTLLPEQAPLLQMLVGPELSGAAARAQIAGRPIDGFASVTSFWQSGPLRGLAVPEAAAEQVRVQTRWFRLDTQIRVGDVALAGSSLIDAKGPEGARVIGRRWEEAE